MKKIIFILMIVLSVSAFANFEYRVGDNGRGYATAVSLTQDSIVGITTFLTEDGYDAYLVMSLYSERLPNYFNNGDETEVAIITTGRDGKVKESQSYNFVYFNGMLITDNYDAMTLIKKANLVSFSIPVSSPNEVVAKNVIDIVIDCKDSLKTIGYVEDELGI